MQIDESFRIDVPVARAWAILSDLARVGPCIPGVELEAVVGEEYRGVLSVQVGAIAARYRGSATLESADGTTRTLVIEGSGDEHDDEGHASVTLKLTLLGEGDRTRVDLDADLSITGRIAQFGSDTMGEEFKKLVAGFVENLERDVIGPDVVDLTEPEETLESFEELVEEGPDELVAEAVAARAEPAASPSGNGAAVRKSDHEVIAPVGPPEAAGPSVIRRLAPLAGLAAAAFLARMVLRRRRR